MFYASQIILFVMHRTFYTSQWFGVMYMKLGRTENEVCKITTLRAIVRRMHGFKQSNWA